MQVIHLYDYQKILGIGEMVPLGKWLSLTHEDQSSVSRTHVKGAMSGVARVCNPRAMEAESGKSPRALWPAIRGCLLSSRPLGTPVLNKTKHRWH